uniref:Wilms tumor protein homolog n=1 Tax=Hyaloperonospora arabidopsidis (strain Emoy2) TaxID=559515 RepID=M4BDW1_HYAAE
MMSLLAQPLSPRTSSTLLYDVHDSIVVTSQTSSTSTVKDRPFVCDEPGCGRRFNRKFTLSEHMKTHTGEKPYVCPLPECGRRFSTSGNLSRHKRLHASLKPFECDINGCQRSFPNQEKLEHHMKIHTGRQTHMCSVLGCTKTFSTAGNLTRHVKTRHPELVRKPSPSMHRHPRPAYHHRPVAHHIRIPSPHLTTTVEFSKRLGLPIPLVYSPDSVELSSFHDEMTAFHTMDGPPSEVLMARPRDMDPRMVGLEPTVGDVSRCSMSVLDELIEFELTKNV